MGWAKGVGMFERSSIRKQFIINFILIIVCSIVAFLVTFLGGVIFIDNIKEIHPANYYERKVPEIQKYIVDLGESLLEENNRSELEKVIPESGIKYRVIGVDEVSYGTFEYDQKYSINEFLLKINTQDVTANNTVTKYVPIMSSNGNLKGVVLIQYKLILTSSDRYSIYLFIAQIFINISPFLYIIVFTFIFGSKFTKRIKKPLKIIEEATYKIRNNDLDFKLEYEDNNELGDVIKSVEAMRSGLEESLKSQWISESEKRDIISALSHDLRTPLTVIKGNVEMLLDGAYKNEARLLKYLGGIEKSANKSVELLGELNYLSKLENEEIPLSLKNINVYEFLEEEISTFEGILAEKNINLKRCIGDNIKEEFMNIDTLKVSQVIDNIISNAIRYTESGGSIKVKVEKNKDKLIISISNTGDGFSIEELKYALIKFYRGDKSRNSRGGNLGLGLYICKNIILKHQGNFNIYNNSNNEATVEFDFNLEK